MPQIPVARDEGPAPGPAGFGVYGERARARREELSLILGTGDSIADSIRGLGQTMTAVGAQLREHEIRLATEEESIGAMEQLLAGDAELRQGLLAEPNALGRDEMSTASFTNAEGTGALLRPPQVAPEDLPQAYLERFADLTERIGGGLRYDASKSDLRERAMNLANQGAAAMLGEAAHRLASRGKLQLDRLGDLAVRSAQLGDEVALDNALGEYDRRAHSLDGTLDVDYLGAHQDRTEAGVSAGRLGYWIENDLPAAARMVNEHPESLPGLDIAKARDAVAGAQAAARAAGRNDRLVALDQRIESLPDSPGSAGAILAQIDRMSAGKDADLAPHMRRSARERVKTVLTAAAEEAANTFDVRAVLRGEGDPEPGNPKYVKKVSDYWTKFEAPQTEELQPAEKAGVLLQFAGKMGVVPTRERDILGGHLMALDEKSVDAADFVRTAFRRYPGLVSQFTTDEKLHANVVTSFAMLDVEGQPSRAPERALATLAVAPAERERIARTVKDELKTNPFDAQVQEKIGTTKELAWWRGREPAEIPPRAMTQIRQVYDYSRQAGAKHDDAMTTALQVARGTWGVSRINGNAQLLEYAPEQWHGDGDPASVEWMKTDLLAEIRPVLPEAARALDDDALAERLRVVPDVMTGQTFDATGKRVVDYVVQLRTDDGSVNLKRWTPFTAQTSPTLAAERVEANEDALASMRWREKLGRSLENLRSSASQRTEGPKLEGHVRDASALLEQQFPATRWGTPDAAP